MKVKIDADLCTGHGRCCVVAPEFYKLDDNGYNADRGKTLDVPAGLEAAARLGAKRCPERAIAMIED
jgi:ferredoxin